MPFENTTPEQIREAYLQGWKDCELDAETIPTTNKMVIERYPQYSAAEAETYINAGEDWERNDTFRLDLLEKTAAAIKPMPTKRL